MSRQHRWALLLLTAVASAQRQPESAHVNLYFPQIAIGGSSTETSTTTFTFLNAGTLTAYARLSILAEDGTAVAVDFGSGPVTVHNFEVPGGSTRQLRATSSRAVRGWAAVYTPAPLQAVATIRRESNPPTEYAVHTVLPTPDYAWPGNRDTMISLANMYTDSPVRVRVGLVVDGRLRTDPVEVSIPANGASTFALRDKLPSLDGTTGVIFAEAVDRPGPSFVAGAYGVGASTITMPQGGASWPISHWERIWLVYWKVVGTAVQTGVIDRIPELRIIGGREVNAYARDGQTIGVSLGLSQLISDSPSELAFAIAHELGHIYQQRNSGKREFHPNAEFDADVWGTLLCLGSGYDPYAAAGTLAKLSMAAGRAGLLAQFEEQLATDAHKSFNSRLDNVFDNLVAACNSSSRMKQTCDAYKGSVHPNLPEVAPLNEGTNRAATQ